jgi:TM2 domain-containing membrane protein YozV
MFCPKCGKETPENQAFCASCGAPLTQAATPGAPAAVAAGISPKSRLAVALFSFPWLIGQFGVHRFYLGKTGTAVVMLILTIIGYATCWLLIGFFFLAITWVWALIDFILAVAGNMKDKDGLLIDKW